MAYDVLIVGGGPAGCSAAIFLARAGKQVQVIDDETGGSQRALVRNHYGRPEDTPGPTLLADGKQQAKKYGASFANERVQKAERIGDLWRLTTPSHTFEAPILVLATGTQTQLAEQIGVPLQPGREPHVRQIAVHDGRGKTALPGLWVAGILFGVSVHTIITAGNGAQVAVEILSEERGTRFVDHDVLSSQPTASNS
ncbi:MAG: NAD(P)/FAD-dependent oxidoreductase [Firmicutes bacterium]|nr:NAD(P)/FAD-dependent oxidoreductase [Bacillota bacterium]